MTETTTCTRPRYTMQRWTGREWTYHSTLSATETRAMLTSLRAYPGDWKISEAMADLNAGERVQTHGYAFKMA